MSGTYTDCNFHIVDHGGNNSNTIFLPSFIYALGNQTVCYDPALTIYQDECFALASLYDTTEGEDWYSENDADGGNDWFDSPNVSSWYGVSVDQ